MLKDSPSGYGLISIFLHWVSALVIIFVFGLGVYMTGLDYYSPWYHRGPEIHIALGILIFLVMSLRLIWRICSRTPDAIQSIPRSVVFVANLSKALLYAGVFLICITGYLITTAEGSNASFFGIFSIPALFNLSSDGVDLAGLLHEYAAWGLITIVLIHATAALFHHFVRRDKTLVRMLKPTQKSIK